MRCCYCGIDLVDLDQCPSIIDMYFCSPDCMGDWAKQSAEIQLGLRE